MRDLNEEDPLEIEAAKNNLNYVKLDGNIGCMVNGAGLAMATMDVIKLAGSEPANFLGRRRRRDQGNRGGRFPHSAQRSERQRHLHQHFRRHRSLRANCAWRDRGGERGEDQVPLVVRLQGTNAEEGRKLLAESGLKLEVANDLWEAAQKIVKLTGKAA